MARKGGFDDEGGGGVKKGGTMSLDVSKLDLDDGPSRRGGGRHDAEPQRGSAGLDRPLGRSAGLGKNSRHDEPDDDERKPKSGGGGFGFGKSKTAAFDASELDLPKRGSSRGGGWAKGDGDAKRSGAGLHDDDDLAADKARKLKGSRRDSALALDDEAAAPSGFHDWQGGGASATPARGGAAPGGDEAPAKLVIREPGKEDRVFPLKLKARSYTVGREVSCDIVLSDIKASRQHFEISYLAGAFTVKDLGSGNGTRVNGEKTTRLQLEDGMVITVGDCEIAFSLDEALLARLLAGGGEPSRRRGSKQAEAPEEEPEAPRVMSGLGRALVVLLMVGTLLFSASLVVWLILKPSSKRPGGAKMVELEEIPKEDPSLRAAEQETASAIARNAESQNGLGKLWEARRLAQVALQVNPGQEDAKTLLGTVERALKAQKSDACQVELTPSTPRRGAPLTIKLRLNGPVAGVTGNFLDTPLTFTPDGQDPGSWTVTFKPPRGPAGPQPLELAVVDLLDQKLDLQQDVPVR